MPDRGAINLKDTIPAKEHDVDVPITLVLRNKELIRARGGRYALGARYEKGVQRGYAAGFRILQENVEPLDVHLVGGCPRHEPRVPVHDGAGRGSDIHEGLRTEPRRLIRVVDDGTVVTEIADPISIDVRLVIRSIGTVVDSGTDTVPIGVATWIVGTDADGDAAGRPVVHSLGVVADRY